MHGREKQRPFLVTGTDRVGKTETHKVEAGSAQEAAKILESMGFIDVTLHTDDVMAATWHHDVQNENDEDLFTSADMLVIRDASSWRFFLFLVGVFYRKTWWLMLPTIGVLIYRLWLSQALSWTSVGIGIFLLLPVLFAFIAAFLGSATKYNQMLQSYAWGRWQQVLDQLPAIQGKIPEFELDIRKAGALAGLGRLDEGLKIMERHSESSETPRWMYLARMSDVYENAGQHERALACCEMALEDAPENPTVQLEVALALLKNQVETTRARHLIDRAEQQHLNDLIQMTLPLLKGILALNEGRSLQAEPLFHEALKRLQRIAAACPLVGVIQDDARAYLAITYAQLGDREKAEELFRIAEPRLKALKMTHVLDRYNEQMKKI